MENNWLDPAKIEMTEEFERTLDTSGQGRSFAEIEQEDAEGLEHLMQLMGFKTVEEALEFLDEFDKN
jgi:hypothetical protein